MASHVTQLLVTIERLRAALNKVPGAQLKSKPLRGELRGLAETYFDQVRPSLVGHASGSQNVAEVDAIMQAVLKLCHKQGSTQKYKDLLKQLKGHLIHLDGSLIATPAAQDTSFRADVDIAIVTTLRALLPTAAMSYEQAIADLSQDDRLSYRGPATDLREALRETLDRLAPDHEVTNAAGYRQEKDTSGPTMKQKVRFILKSRSVPRAAAATTEDATSSIDEAIGAFVRSVYTRSSVSTHTATNRDEVLRIRDLVRVVLCELLEIRV